ncbi:hypothetical protein Q9R08_20280 [Microbacterium sp. QXD-8]|uniref:Uncharacterized protein n=1 Tax=Microbacterium psychrotolerans TaxID=3068321 RepID=A0ABU0Z733_9MICO|nr:hypothetical protein [Microbacterium sp. QXD-8]MDQ7880337.1 hypothetical protein [Microbacterium sp. QXD-8]
MSDLLSVFDENDPGARPTEVRPLPMTGEQRSEIRELFATLDVATASRQFEVTAELTGVRITSVAELDAATAHRLIGALKRRVETSGRLMTGNSWDDREEDTWLDRL